MVQNNNNKQEGYGAAAYLFVASMLAGGAILSALYNNPDLFAIGIVLSIIAMGIYIATEIRHKRSIKKMQAQGRIEISKITAAKAPAQPTNVIDGTAQVVPNFMPPKPQPQLEYRKLIESDEARYVPRNWTYRLSSGSVARGDLIEALVTAAHDERDTNMPLREYVRTQYKIEFGNDSYTRAFTALMEEGATDKSGKWLIEKEDIPELIGRMRSNGNQPMLPSPSNRG